MKKFKFEMEVEEIAYNEVSPKEIFGETATYNPDFPEHSFAIDRLHDLFQDAYYAVSMLKMQFIAQHKIENTDTLTGSNKIFWNYLCGKEDSYRKIQESIKPI